MRKGGLEGSVTKSYAMVSSIQVALSLGSGGTCCASAVHLLCICCASAVHLLCICCASAVHLLCTCCASAVHLLCICCASAVHLLCICCAPAVHLLCTCCAVVGQGLAIGVASTGHLLRYGWGGTGIVPAGALPCPAVMLATADVPAGQGVGLKGGVLCPAMLSCWQPLMYQQGREWG